MFGINLPDFAAIGGFLERVSAGITAGFDNVGGIPPLPNPPRIDKAEPGPAGGGGVQRYIDKERTCTWQKTNFLLMAEYIGAAIMSFPAAFAEMGIVPALCSVFFIGITYCYTSHVLWRFCLRHSDVRDVCDIGRLLFGPRYGKFGYWLTVCMFVLNNISVMGVHVQLCGELLQSLVEGYTVTFSPTMVGCVVGAFFCFCLSMPPAMSYHAKMAFAAVAFTLLGILMTIVGAGIHYKATKASRDGRLSMPPDVIPEVTSVISSEISLNFTTDLSPESWPDISPWPKKTANILSIVISFLNMAFAFIGQVTFPTFIAEMKEPRDFPKALHSSMVVQYFIFLLYGLCVYCCIGGENIQSPAVKSLTGALKPLISGFFAPTVILLGALYAAVTVRFVLVRIFANDRRHLTENTLKGWLSRIGILATFWTIAFIISQCIPSFSTLLAIVGAVFAAIFGYIYWGVAWVWMQNVDLRQIGRPWCHRKNILGLVISIFLIVVGMGFFLTLGLWASIDKMMKAPPASKPFSFQQA